ncbi:MAG: DUF371 domain-containing protein [Candidatus Methanofastidiosia archaeon]
MEFVITAKGHPNITATHRTTLEITKESQLTHQGDCIVAVCADKGFPEMSDSFKSVLRKSLVNVSISCNDKVFELFGRGSEKLALTDMNEMVIRKSNFTCKRTLIIESNKAACDMPKDMVSELQKKDSEIKIIICPASRQSNISSRQNNRI